MQPEPVRLVQLKFQPGATSRGRKRFLAWNEHGCLKLVISNSSQHRHVQMDYYKCQGPTCREIKANGVEIGALGPGLCALASPTHLTVHLAMSLLTSSEPSSFEHRVASGERIEAVAVSRSFVAIFVSPRRFLHIFTPQFVPIARRALRLDIISMVASEKFLFCVFQAPAESPELPKEPQELQLHFGIFDVEKNDKISCGRLAISPRSTLRWIGFSAEMQPLTLDSAGVLRAMMDKTASKSWSTIADLGSECNSKAKV